MTRRSDPAVDVPDRPVEQRGGPRQIGLRDYRTLIEAGQKVRRLRKAGGTGHLGAGPQRLPGRARIDSPHHLEECGAGRVRRPGRASPIRPDRRPVARSRRPLPTPAASEHRRRAVPGPARPALGRGGPESPRTPCSSANDAPALTTEPSMSGRTAPAGTTHRPRQARRRRGTRPRWPGLAPAGSACSVVAKPGAGGRRGAWRTPTASARSRTP